MMRCFGLGRRSLRPTRSAAIAILGLSACSASIAAYAEIAVKSAKSDKAVVLASLDWQPSNSGSADWVAFKPGTPTIPTGETAAATAGQSQNPLNDAFSLFAKSEPVKMADTNGFALRTASIDPDAAWIPGMRQVASDATPAAIAPAPVGSTPTAPPPIQLGFAIPIPPRAKPKVPRIQVASLTPTEQLPDAETHTRALDAAPILGEPRRIPEGATAYIEIFKREASIHKIPLWLALGVAWVESKFDPKLRGTHTVVGMMQVMPSTAREMGYHGTTNQLFDPETNIIWGMKELAQDYEIAKGDICLTIAKYKGGFHTRSINKGAWNYCSQVKHVTGMAEVASAK
jgi:soluble lytic murein transglycosylase-like protein